MKNTRNSLLMLLCFSGITTVSFSQAVNDNSIKKNIVPITNATDILLRLEPKKYEYNTQQFKHLNLKPGIQYGFLAENMQQVFPELVNNRNITYMYSKNSYRDTKIKTIEEESLIPVLVASIKELNAEINKLKAELAAIRQGK